MTDLPRGFVLDAPAPQAAGLPPGFVIDPNNPEMSTRDMVGAVAKPVVGGVASLVGLPQAILSAPGQIADYLGFGGGERRIPGADPSRRALAPPVPVGDGSAVPGLPSSRDVQSFAHETLGIPSYTATSRPGKLAQAGLEGAVAGGPFGVAGATLGAVSGVTSEGAGQAAEAAGLGQTGQTVARVAGGIVPGLAYGAYKGIRRTPGALANEALDGVTPQQLQQAQALMDAAQARGVPLTAAEAIAQVTGGNPLQNVQRVVEQSARGGPRMQAFMADRPEQVRQAIIDQLDEIGQPRVPSQVVNDVAAAGRERIQQSRAARTQASSPHYRQAVNDVIDQAALKPIYDQLDDAARGAAPGSPLANLIAEYRDRLKGVTNAAQGDDIYKTFRERLDALPINPNAIQASQGGVLKPINKAFGDILRVESPNIDMGRNVHAMNSARVEYLRRPDIMGKLPKALDETNDVAAAQTRQAGVIFDPNSARPQTIRAVAGELQSSSNPAAYSDLVRAQLGRMLDEAMGLVGGKPNQWAGSKFVGSVAGTPQQRENLGATLQALPNGQRVATSADELLNVLGATGYRQPPGSMTEFNKQITEQLQGGNLRGALKPTTWLGDTYERFRYGANSQTLADLLTSPDGVKRLEEIARTMPDNARRQALIQMLLAVERGQQTAQGGAQ